MMIKFGCNTSYAMRIAMEYAGLEKWELRCVTFSEHDGLLVIRTNTDFMLYEFYVDVENRETVGFNSEPIAYPGPKLKPVLI